LSKHKKKTKNTRVLTWSLAQLLLLLSCLRVRKDDETNNVKGKEKTGTRKRSIRRRPALKDARVTYKTFTFHAWAMMIVLLFLLPLVNPSPNQRKIDFSLNLYI
jgi:hypothetical protein